MIISVPNLVRLFQSPNRAIIESDSETISSEGDSFIVLAPRNGNIKTS